MAEVTTVQVRSRWLGGQYGTWCLHKKRSRDGHAEKPREDGAELEQGVYSPRNCAVCRGHRNQEKAWDSAPGQPQEEPTLPTRDLRLWLLNARG